MHAQTDKLRLVAFFVSPDGVRLHYEIEGSGPPLVLHLGAGADADLWHAAGYVEHLAKSCTCILFDHRGHGKSDHPASVEANHIDRYADDLTALVEQLGYMSVSFFGWSNGVQVGLKVADQHPGIFDALILFGAIPPRRTREELALAAPARVAALREKGWWEVIGDMIATEASCTSVVHPPRPSNRHRAIHRMVDSATGLELEPLGRDAPCQHLYVDSGR